MAVSKQELPEQYVISGVRVLDSKLLGEGAYGVVHLGRYYGLPCAVKKLKPSMFPAGIKQLDQQTELILQSFYNECDKLSKIRHPNIVQFLGVYTDARTSLPVIVMELMHESLTRLLYRTKVLPLCTEVNICLDLAQAMAYLHSFKPPVVHRDLSSNNVLLNRQMKAKITDLGVAKVAKGCFLNWDNTPAPGTLAYMPPEVRKIPADLTPAMDVFALGVNAIQIRTHKLPRPGPEFATGRLGFSKMVSEKDRRKDHLELMGKSHPLKALALDCIQDNPRDRPTALRMCDTLEQVRETRQFIESQRMEHVKESEVAIVRERISGLEQTVVQLQDELTNKVDELHKTQMDLNREREYTSQLLKEKAREQLQRDIAQAGLTVSLSENPSTENRKKKRHRFKLKRVHIFRKKRLMDIGDSEEATGTTDDSTTGKSKPGQCDLADSVTSPAVNHSYFRSHLTGEVNVQDTSNCESSTPNQKLNQSITKERIDSGRKAKTQYKVNKLQWYSHQCLPQGVQGSTLHVHVFSGKVLLSGGSTEDGLPSKAMFFCSTRNLTSWSRVYPDVPQYHGASVIVHGELVLIGGLNAMNGQCTGALSSYDFKAKVWVQRFPPLPTPRSSASAFVYGDYLVVIGGCNDLGNVLNVVEVLHTPSQIWGTATQLPVNIAGLSLGICNDFVYLVGGHDELYFLRSVYCASIHEILSSCNQFSCFKDRLFTTVWKELNECPFTKMAVASIGNQLLAFGGEEVTLSANAHPAEWIWVFDPSDSTWTPVQEMPTARKLCGAALLPDNNIVIIGGEPDFNRIDLAEIL